MPLPQLDANHDRPTIFLHIPKTAGTSFRKLLENFFDARQISPISAYHVREMVEMPAEQRDQYRLFRGHYPYEISQLFKQPPILLTLLRHPVDCAISQYRFARQSPGHYAHHLAQTMTLADFFVFLRETQKQSFSSLINPYACFLGGQYSIKTTINETNIWDLPADGDYIEVAKQRLQKMDYLGIVERFNESIEVLCYLFRGFPQSTPTVYNRSVGGAENADDQTRALLAEINAADMEIYAYASTLFQATYKQFCTELVAHYGDNESAQDTHTLLFRHYETRYSSSTTTTTPVKIAMSQAIHGVGWESARWHPGRGLWTRQILPGQMVTLDVATLDKTQDWVVRCAFVRRLPVNLFRIHLKLNGHPLKTKLRRGRQGMVFLQARLKDTHLKAEHPFNRLNFEVERGVLLRFGMVIFKKLRRLGAEITWVEFVPTPTPKPPSEKLP